MKILQNYLFLLSFYSAPSSPSKQNLCYGNQITDRIHRYVYIIVRYKSLLFLTGAVWGNLKLWFIEIIGLFMVLSKKQNLINFRYKNASGDAILQTNEIAELIKKMCDSFTQSQEKLLLCRNKPMTSDMQVQCEPERDRATQGSEMDVESPRINSPSKIFAPQERCVNPMS